MTYQDGLLLMLLGLVGATARGVQRAGGATARFLGEPGRRKAERAAGAASLDAEHARIGIGGDRTLNHYAHHGKSYAESNNLVSGIRQNQGPKSINDHLAVYQHMLANHHGDYQGDKIVHTSLNLPEGKTHDSVIDNHEFAAMMHPDSGHAGYQPTADYQNNAEGAIANVHKVLGEYAGGKVPPMMDTGAGQRNIQSDPAASPAVTTPQVDTRGVPTGEGGQGRTPGMPSAQMRQTMGLPKETPAPTWTPGAGTSPTGTTPPTGPNRKRPELSEITASIDKMLNKALRSKPRSYSKGWGVRHHVNR